MGILEPRLESEIGKTTGEDRGTFPSDDLRLYCPSFSKDKHFHKNKVIDKTIGVLTTFETKRQGTSRVSTYYTPQLF